jgi:hypothetical protein
MVEQKSTFLTGSVLQWISAYVVGALKGIDAVLGLKNFKARKLMVLS